MKNFLCRLTKVGDIQDQIYSLLIHSKFPNKNIF